MNSVVASRTSKMLINVPYCRLVKHLSTVTYEVFYSLALEPNYIIKVGIPEISGQFVHLRIDIAYQEDPESTQSVAAGSTFIPKKNSAGQDNIQVEVTAYLLPHNDDDIVVICQPQRSGTTTINYDDADEE